jgi:mevalonate kinase
MATSEILDILEGYKSKVSGWKLSGAGGGGYFIFLSEFPVANGLQIRIRRG